MRAALALSSLCLPFAACADLPMPDGPLPELELESEHEFEGGERPHPNGITARWAHRTGADGTIPVGSFVRMKAQRDAMLDAQAVDAGGSEASLASAPRNWQWRGPGNIGGRIRAIVIHPTMPNTIWVGSASGGIWKTTDGGTTWVPLNDMLPVLAITCMVMDPADPNRLYAGTGEGGFFDSPQGTSSLAVPNGAGVFTTADGGATWTDLPATAGWLAVNRLAIDPNNSSILLAATPNGIYRSVDAGASWSLRYVNGVLDVDFHPTDSLLAVAGERGDDGLYSTDGGVTWANATGITSSAIRVETAYAASSPNVVYAAASVSGSIRIYRSNDGGQTYTQQSPNSTISTYSRYNNALWVDPTNPSRVVCGGVRLYRSNNSGSSLTNITGGIHLDMHVFVEHPGYDGVNNRIVFGGTDGGIDRNDNIVSSSNWVDLNNGLGITQFYGAAINPTSGVIFGGTQDNGTIRWGGGSVDSWTTAFGADGGNAEADPSNPNYFYGEIQDMRIFRSTNGGFSASYIYNVGSNPIVESNPNFIAPFELDPNNPNTMLAGGDRLWRSQNVKASVPSWFPIKPSIGPVCSSESGASASEGPSHFAIDPPCNISAIAIAPDNSDVVWVGHNSGQLYKSTNATTASPTWARMDSGTSLPNRFVSRIAIDSQNINNVYVAFQGYNADNLWRSTDGGATWNQATGAGASALPSSPITSIAIHRRLLDCVYVGTDVGVFWSGDGGATWATSPDGSATAPIDELDWRDTKTLLVVSHGRGIWEADTFDGATVASVGTGCGIGGPPVLSLGAPQAGLSQSYQLSNAAANAPVTLLMAVGAPSALPLSGCVLQVPFPGRAFGVGNTDAQGAWSMNVGIPPVKILMDVTLTAQTVTMAAGGPLFGGGELSNGVTMTIGL